MVSRLVWTPGNLTQAEDRICRGGQVEEYCNIYYLYASGADMDEVFADTLTSKFDTINATIDGGTGDSIDYISLINDALEKSTGIKKVRKMVKVEDDEPIKVAASVKKSDSTTKKSTDDNAIDFKAMSVEALEELAKKVGAEYKQYDNPGIYRMRLVMAIKKAM